MKVENEIRSAGPAVPVGPNHGPDGTRPSSDTSPATAVAVGVTCAPESRRAHELCALGMTERHRCVHKDMHNACVSSAQAVAMTCRVKGALSDSH